ncbi:MAG: hypothetical protein IPP32_07640 [Bacteroidetes bacterium]|nr:hypothetical protein [Bacteroidota bacterium]
MKAKISDYQSLLLEKQRLKLECSTQEKDMADNFVQLKAKLNPTLMIKEAILEIIPRDIRENSIVNLVSAFFTNKKEQDSGFGSSIFSLAKTSLLTLAISYLTKFLEKD